MCTCSLNFSFFLPKISYFSLFSPKFSKNFESGAVQKQMHLVDLKKCCKTPIYLQRSVPIHAKKSKFCRNFDQNLTRNRTARGLAGGQGTPLCPPSRFLAKVSLRRADLSCCNGRSNSRFFFLQEKWMYTFWPCLVFSELLLQSVKSHSFLPFTFFFVFSGVIRQKKICTRSCCGNGEVHPGSRPSANRRGRPTSSEIIWHPRRLRKWVARSIEKRLQRAGLHAGCREAAENLRFF